MPSSRWASGRAPSRSRRPTTTTTTRPGSATACAMPTILDDDARVADTGTRYDGLDRYEARAAILDGPRGARRPGGRRRPTRWSSGGASAATTSWSRASRRSGSCAPAPLAAAALERDPERPDADPARAVREDLGALDDRTSATGTCPASCGGATASRPGTARTATSRCRAEADGPTACEVCGRPASELTPGPRHLRHLVQLRAVAVLDARLAGPRPTTCGATTRAR